MYIVSENLQKTPYVLFASFGTHSHPSSPPTKMPADVQKDILNIIKRTDTVNLTTGQ